MNDLSIADTPRRRCAPIPPVVPRVLLPIFLAGLAVAVFILVVVRNALLLGSVLFLSALVLLFLLWNVVSFRRNRAVLLFLDRFPGSDLRLANDGQLVKITGFASCGDLSLESSYEKVGKCIYTSTLLYEYGRSGPKLENASNQCFRWNLTYLERYIADFHVTDMRSGTRVLVKAGCNSKVIPLIKETILVNTTSKNRELSSTLKKWLEERHLSSETRLLRLEEGYVKEGSSLTVMGMLSRDGGVLMIVPPTEPISTGCFLQNFLLPTDVDGLVLKFSSKATSTANLVSTLTHY